MGNLFNEFSYLTNNYTLWLIFGCAIPLSVSAFVAVYWLWHENRRRYRRRNRDINTAEPQLGILGPS
jgi:hypothetical protein